MRTISARADDFIVDVLAAIADRMTATGLPGAELRERRHLDPFFKDEIERRTGARPVSRKLSTPDFPGLGAVDVIVARPRALIELKWSYDIPGKIFESVWDAIKLCLLGPRHGYESVYVVTGASRASWAASESADLFERGEIDPSEMWARPLVPRRGPNMGATIGKDVEIGGNGNRPLRVPARIATRPIGTFEIAHDYVLRGIAIATTGPLIDLPS